MRTPPPPAIWAQNDSPELSEHKIDLWQAPLNLQPASIPEATAVLSPREIERADKFRTAELRHRYIAGRFWLRYLLHLYLGSPPASIDLDEGANGKPALRSGGLFFNLSHSGNIAVYAFCREHPVGVDIEFLRPDIRPLEIAKRFFSHDEQQQLVEVSQELRLAAFFECWTRKEAYCKATGLGLQQPLKDFSVSFGDSEACRFREIGETNWHLHDLQMGKEWRGALAYRGDAKQLAYQAVTNDIARWPD